MQQVFKHKFFDFEPLDDIMVDGKRYYKLPDCSLAKSVTTRLGEVLDKSGLDEWRAKVGEEEVNKILTQAGRRGTAFHSICENYLMNVDYKRGVMPVNLQSFIEIREYLDRNIGTIYGLEAPLYSYSLKAAGRSDCIADWSGTPSIVDFKTSKKPKQEEWIRGYFLQATTYSMMMEERTGLHIPQLVIIIAVDNDFPQIYVKKTSDFSQEVKQIFV